METYETNFPEEQGPQETNSQNETNAPKQPRKRRNALRSVLSVVLVLAMVAGSCCLTYGVLNSRWEEKAQADAGAVSQKQPEAAVPDSITATNVTYAVSPEGAQTPKMVYENNAKSVVAVSATVQTTAYGQTRTGSSGGSGFILSEDGYVVTNCHVVENATAVQVTLSTGDEYEAKVIGSDKLNDVALLKIEATNLPAVKIGSSDNLAIGDMVCAIGNPLGSLTATLTVGYVSGKDRQVTTDNTTINMIQTDAAINSGNSGGPLFDMNGNVVGITTAKYSGTTNSGTTIEGIGFAIPIDDVTSILDDLRTNGRVTNRAYIGITASNVSSSDSENYGFPQGVLVNSVESGSCGEKAGLRRYDIITGIDNTTIKSLDELSAALKSYRAGDTATLEVYRSGKTMQMTVTFDEKPQTTTTASDNSAQQPSENQQGGQQDDQQSGGSSGWGFPWNILP